MSQFTIKRRSRFSYTPRRMKPETAHGRIASTIHNQTQLNAFLAKLPEGHRAMALEFLSPHLKFKARLSIAQV